MRIGLALSFAAMALLAAPAGAVGMGPLSKSGLTDGPAKAFYLTVSNPYDRPESFRVFAEDPGLAERVALRPAEFRLGAGKSRTVLAIATGLAAEETFKFRVCARKFDDEKDLVRAKVCSTLSARRVDRAPR